MISSGVFPNLKAQGAEVNPLFQQAVNQPAVLQSAATLPQSPILPDGTYLYGQFPQAEHIGSTYVVFEVRQNRITGALYMPQSSFDCFQGELQPNQLALTVTDSYDQMQYPYSLPVDQSATVAGSRSATTDFRLVGYHPIARISATDRRILTVCKAN
jgi:hypothetical protein